MSKLRDTLRAVYRRLRTDSGAPPPLARPDRRDTARALALWAGVLV